MRSGDADARIEPGVGEVREQSEHDVEERHSSTIACTTGKSL